MKGFANFLHNSVNGTWSVYAIASRSDRTGVAHIINYDATPNCVAQFLRVGSTINPIGFIPDGTPFFGSSSTAITPNTRFIAGAVNTTSTITAFLDGIGGLVVSHGAPITVSNTFYSVGVYESGSGFVFVGDFWSVQISKILVYATALLPNQRQQIEGYLAHKWNLKANLPGNHPFATIPPSA